MNLTSAGPVLKAATAAVLVLLLGIYLAAQTGKGNLVVPIYFLIGVGVLPLRQLFVKHFRLEALILGALLFGYVVGQSGIRPFQFLTDQWYLPGRNRISDLQRDRSLPVSFSLVNGLFRSSC
jgi:hypothetical protein